MEGNPLNVLLQKKMEEKQINIFRGKMGMKGWKWPAKKSFDVNNFLL